MFARAAIIGRVARERAEARRNILLTRQEIKKKTPVAPLRRRCFLPFMRIPCAIVAGGLFLIICGAVMCNFAFHAKDLSMIIEHQYNMTTESVNKVKFEALSSLTYIGPAVMGMGVFIIIIACVTLLDKRDKILKEYINSMLEVQQELSMELSYHAVVSSGNSPARKPPVQDEKKFSQRTYPNSHSTCTISSLVKESQMQLTQETALAANGCHHNIPEVEEEVHLTSGDDNSRSNQQLHHDSQV